MSLSFQRRQLFAAAAAAILLLGAGQAVAGSHHDNDAAVIEHSQGDDALQSLPRLPISQRRVVGIYQFRSGVPGVQNAAAADMFTTALVESGAFMVGERSQMTANVVAERQLNAAGQTSGDAATHQLAGAQLLFEGVISESNDNQDNTQNGFTVGGMQLTGSSQKGKIAIDVRVIDPATGLVLDSIVVSKVVRAHGSGLSGLGTFANSIAGLSGHSIPLSPDYTTQTTHNDGVDEALRACIDTAVLELVKRYGGAG